MIWMILAMGGAPGAAVNNTAERASDGGNILWPMFLLALFAVVSWKLWKFARRTLVKLPNDWESKFWADYNDWRGDPTNRV